MNWKSGEQAFTAYISEGSVVVCRAQITGVNGEHLTVAPTDSSGECRSYSGSYTTVFMAWEAQHTPEQAIRYLLNELAQKAADARRQLDMAESDVRIAEAALKGRVAA